MLQRNNAHASCWVGTWRLMVAYKAPRLDAMVMPHLGAVVNVYACTRLRWSSFREARNSRRGRALARLIAPGHDLAEAVNAIRKRDISKEALLEGSKALAFDPARLLAALEKRDSKLRRVRDEELAVVVHHDGPQHVHIDKTEVPGVYHVGVAVDGGYRPDVEAAITHAHDHDAAPSDARSEPFQRVLSTAVALPGGSGRSRRRSHR
jgi:hypothetical protein